MIFVAVSTGHFDPLIEACNQISNQFDFYGQIGSCTTKPNFPHERMMPPQEIEKKMAEAELVVSHAGTGMLSMLYGLKKKIVIAPKQIKYGEANDGQIELAVKWAELGMGILCLNVDHLREKILLCREMQSSFPTFPSLGTRILGEKEPSDDYLKLNILKYPSR